MQDRAREIDRLFISVGRKLKGAIRRNLPDNLSVSQMWVLRILDRRGAMAMSQIAEALEASLSAATSIVNQMVDAGLVTRRRSEDDRRVVLVESTHAGADMIARLKAVRHDVVERTFMQLPEAEIEQLTAILRRLSHLLEAQETPAAGKGEP